MGGFPVAGSASVSLARNLRAKRALCPMEVIMSYSSCGRVLVRSMLFGAALLLVRPVEGKPQAITPAAVPQPGQRAERWQAPKGPFEVATLERITLHDATRKKDLEATLRFPVVSGPDAMASRFPLIIFSHGMGGSRTAFAELSEFWASHGYVVVHPTHSDSLELQKRADPKAGRGFMTDPRAYTKNVDPADRLADVKFLLDSLDAIEAFDQRLGTKEGGRIDSERIGMAGHSAGALTTQMAIGVGVRGLRGLADGESFRQRMAVRSVGDARIDVGVIISGQGTTSRMLTKDSWLKVSVPTLTITGSKDTSRASNETPESRRHSFEFAPGVAKGGQPAYLLWLEGATHGSYQGKGLSSLLGEGNVAGLDIIVRATKVGTLAMLDAYLKNDEVAIALLKDSDAAERATEGLGTIEHK